MVNGWHFVLGDMQYWVGAVDAAAAKAVLSNRDGEAAKTEPEAIPDSVVKFLQLRNGLIIASRVFFDWVS